MSEKLIIALDYPEISDAKNLVNQLGDQAVFYKIGLELMASGDYFPLVEFLKNKNKKIFADLKFFDISQTVGRAVKNLAKFEIDLLTIHCANRETMHYASENKGAMKVIGVSILTNLGEEDMAEIGFDKNLSVNDLVLNKTALALESGLDGVVSSPQEVATLRRKFGENFLIVTPGIRLEKIASDDQKRVGDVKGALHDGASHLVVGRPITQSENPVLAAQKFLNLIYEFENNSLKN
jgi:orotidine-5'-phosphate decarboxylase